MPNLLDSEGLLSENLKAEPARHVAVAADAKPDFFISFNKADRAWAEWIAWELEELAYHIVFQPWDFRPGENNVLSIQRAVAEAHHTLAVFSPDYLASLSDQSEWAAAFAADPTGSHGKLVPIRVRDCHLDGLPATINYVDLVGLDEESAREALRNGVAPGRAKPRDRPSFPGPRPALRPAPAFPGPASVPAQPSMVAPVAEDSRGDARGSSIRRWERRRWILGAVVGLSTLVLAGLLYFRLARADDDRRHLSDSNLPPDLSSAQSHLDELWLGGSVTTVNWLSDHLRFLKLRRRPGFLGSAVRGPEIPWTEAPAKFVKLPADLAGLDISDLRPSDPDRVNEDALTTLAGLPANLKYLNISYNDRLRSLDGLPRSVTSLSATARGLSQFSSLPSSLSCLDLGSPYFRSPQAQLPRGMTTLQSLSLRGTGVTTLHGLPDSIISLELFNNPDLDTIDELPPLLSALSVDGTRLPSLDALPASLQDLHLSRSRLARPPGPAKEVLKGLKALTLNDVSVPDWSVLPAGLSSLALIAMQAPPALPSQLLSFSYDAAAPEAAVRLPAFPATLEVLVLSSVRVDDLGQLPPALRGLAITNATVRGLAGCPANLVHLDLRSTRGLERITDLPRHLVSLNLLNSRQLTELVHLPESLRFLNVAGTSLARLPNLPSRLEELDISGTRISSLRGLPPGLLSLTLSQGQVRSLEGLPASVRELRFVDTPPDRAAISHFSCEAQRPRFERWPCVAPGDPAERY